MAPIIPLSTSPFKDNFRHIISGSPKELEELSKEEKEEKVKTMSIDVFIFTIVDFMAFIIK